MGVESSNAGKLAQLAQVTHEIALAVGSGDITAVDGVKGMIERKANLENQLGQGGVQREDINAVVDEAIRPVGKNP